MVLRIPWSPQHVFFIKVLEMNARVLLTAHRFSPAELHPRLQMCLALTWSHFGLPDSWITKLPGSCHSSWYNDFKISLRSHKDPSYTLHVLFISLLKVDSGFEEALLKLKQLCQIFRTLSGWERSSESEGACCQASWPEFSLRTHTVKEEIQPLQVVPWCPHTCHNTLNTCRYTYSYKNVFTEFTFSNLYLFWYV